MGQSRKVFYNLFWKNRACQNLFLLSKEELLDTKKIDFDGNSTSISFPRIIISNIESKDSFDHETLRYRTENNSIRNEEIFNQKIELYTPLVINFIESKFSKPINKLLNDLDRDLFRVVSIALSIISADEEERGDLILDALKVYGFIPKNISNLKGIESFFSKEIVSKNFKSALSERNLWNFLEFIRAGKDIYVNLSYKSLYNTNQVLVNALYDIDEFESRLKLFSLLFESKIISSSNEDAFIECMSCEPGTYRGVFQLKINPRKLPELKCPICAKKLTYYIPYDLDQEIYKIVKNKDGLLLDALAWKLDTLGIEYELQKRISNDIEIDCWFYIGNELFIVECKMYKLNTLEKKLRQKIREHFGKLVKDVKRISQIEEYGHCTIKPVLLVNLMNDALLKSLSVELEAENSGEVFRSPNVLNINMLIDILV